MTNEVLAKLFDEVVNEVLQLVKANSPYKTGRLRDSFKVRMIEGGFEIYTDIEYMKYTEMVWTYNKKWDKTLRNPNQGWFERTAMLIAEILAMKIGGNVSVST